MENTEFQPTTPSLPPISVTPETPQPVVESIITPSKPSNFLRIFFLVVALILLGILIGVLATRFLPMSSNTVVPTPTPSITTEPTEILTPTPTVDLTANWNTYINSSGEYSIKYPQTWKVINYGRVKEEVADENTRYVRLSVKPDISKSALELTIQKETKIELAPEIIFDEEKKIGAELAKCGTAGKGVFCWIKVPNQNNFLLFLIPIYENTNDSALIDQILSTFKFTKSIAPTTTQQIDTGPLKVILASINKQLTTNYQESTTDNGLKWTVDLSKSNNKTSLLIIKKAITDFGLVFQTDLSGEAGNLWKEVYMRNADTCSLVYDQSLLTLSCYN